MKGILFLIDLDGTLLNSSGKVCQESIKAIQRAKSKGAQFVIATGRNWEESKKVVKSIGLNGPVIVSSGAMVVDSKSGMVITSKPLDRNTVIIYGEKLLEAGYRVLLLKVNQRGTPEYVLVGNAPLNLSTSWWFKKYKTKYIEIDHFSEDPYIDLTIRVGVAGAHEDLLKLSNTLNFNINEVVVYCWSAVTSTHAVGSETSILEIFSKNVNKWEAFKQLTKESYLKADRIIAIGDGDNDIEMLSGACLGIAMKNAKDHVLKFANKITDSHDEAGVAKAINKQIEILSGEKRNKI